MRIVLISSLTEEQKNNAIKSLIEHSSPRQEFFLMVILSVVMATMGLILDSVAVIIGSMLIAPLLYPVLSASLGLVTMDFKVIFRSLGTLLKSVVLAVFFAGLAAYFFASEGVVLGAEILARAEPSLIYGTVAFVAGLAAAFALAKPQISDTLPGVAISVALIPPVAVMGIGIAQFDILLFRESLYMFLANIGGIVIAGTVAFAMMGLFVKKNTVDRAVEHDVREIAKEERAS